MPRVTSDVAEDEQARTAMRAAGAAVRASGALGQSAQLVALFDFLLETALEGRSPKEAEIASSAAALAEVGKRVGSADSFEALYEVDGIGPTNVSAKLVAAGPLDASLWSRAR